MLAFYYDKLYVKVVDMSKLKLQVPVGTGDYLPDECLLKRRVEEVFRNEFRLNGYDEIETPAFEYYDVFTHDAVQYVQENMIKFFDLKGRILALRPDMTGPIARMAATKLSAASALRLFYIADVYGFKGEGQRSESTQAGIELIGKSGAAADAEVIALAIRSLLLLGLRDFKIDIGQSAFFRGLVEGANLSEEHMERIRLLIDSKNNVELEYELSRINMDEGVKRPLLELPDLFGGVDTLERASALANSGMCESALSNMREVFDILCDFGYSDYISIDFGLLNNFNYYTGILFRGIARGIGVPILSGGRYDGLLGEFGAPRPATGFAAGVREILIALKKQGAAGFEKERATVLRAGPDKRAKAYHFARQMRESGKRVIMETNGAVYDSEEFDVITFE